MNFTIVSWCLPTRKKRLMMKISESCRCVSRGKITLNSIFFRFHAKSYSGCTVGVKIMVRYTSLQLQGWTIDAAFTAGQTTCYQQNCAFENFWFSITKASDDLVKFTNSEHQGKIYYGFSANTISLPLRWAFIWALSKIKKFLGGSLWILCGSLCTKKELTQSYTENSQSYTRKNKYI